MLETIKQLLGDAATAYTDAQINAVFEMTQQEAAAYCNRALDEDLRLIACRMAIVRLNRMNTEGLTAQAFAGVNESYIDGYPQDIMQLLNRKRKVKFV